MLEEERPALMLVDLFMPVMNGAEFLKIVKRNPQLAAIPRVIMTAANDQMIGVKEDVTVLYKPVDFDALDAPPAEVLRARPGALPMREAAAALAAAAVGRSSVTALVGTGLPRAASATRRSGPRLVPDLCAGSAAAGAPLARSPGGAARSWRAVDARRSARRRSLHKQFAVGFAAEVLRTDYLAKQLVRDAQVGRAPLSRSRRARPPSEPTVLIVGGAFGGLGAHGARSGRQGRSGRAGRARGRGVARARARPRAGSPRCPQTLAGLLGSRPRPRGRGRAAGRARGRWSTATRGAMEVIAREWRVGEGPQGRDAARRRHGGAARAVRGACARTATRSGADGAPRPPAELLADPGVAATVIYRLAQSKAVGRQGRARRGLRAVRRRTASRRASARRPCSARSATSRPSCCRPGGARCSRASRPRDIADLVEAYGRALPAERSEVAPHLRGHDLRRDREAGRRARRRRRPGAALPELTALAAEVAAGSRSCRAAPPLAP